MNLSDLLSSFGALRVVDAILQDQYEAEEKAIYEGEAEGNDRQATWNTSFHSSSFPGDDPMSCDRKALYGLMAIPGEGPFSRDSRAYMETGLDMEARVISRLDRAGVLLSSSDPENQMGFESQRYWLEGRVDAIVKVTNYPHVVEVKTISAAKAAEMRAGKRSYEPQHRAQCMTYMWFVRQLQERGLAWQDLDVCDQGSILYISRDRPGEVVEYLISFDQEFMDAGFEKIDRWIDQFQTDTLPARDTAWKWSYPPCQYCAFKRQCKEDVRRKTTSLLASAAIEFARTVNPEYDPKAVRQVVLDRWDTKKKP